MPGGFGPNAFPGIGLGNGFYIRNVYFNPVSCNYNSYGNRRAIFIKSIFDNDFNHLSGTVKPNAFDMINDFKGEGAEKTADETLFKLNGAYYLGQYNESKNTFSINKFQD